jgi:hypothetical protein
LDTTNLLLYILRVNYGTLESNIFFENTLESNIGSVEYQIDKEAKGKIFACYVNGQRSRNDFAKALSSNATAAAAASSLSASAEDPGPP